MDDASNAVDGPPATGAASAYFAASYREARAKFVAAAEAAGLAVESHPHPVAGRDGEPLAMDVALDGPADADALLVVSSGCHGVEGFCGSGVQVALLGHAGLRRAARDAGVAVLHVHALNPYGFSWWRRTTHENVDLNRNFPNFTAPLPRNPGYDELAPLLVPPSWPPSAEVTAALDRFVAEHGRPAWQQAVSGGQHDHPDGLFYGGREPTWSHLTLRRVLRDHATRCRRLGWIDVHTGLGPPGVGERIFAGRPDPAALARARAWWSDGVTSIDDGTSSSARLEGLMWRTAYQECGQAEYTGIALEYGTVPLVEMIDALRADQWLALHPEADPGLAQRIKQATLAAFYIDDDAWKQRVVEQAFEAAREAIGGLAAERSASRV